MKSKLLLGGLCGFYFLIIGGALFFGTVELIQWLHMFAVHNAPIVSGHVIARKPLNRGVSFTIQLQGIETRVYARTASYLLNEVPDEVRFHYSGDPSREVYLFEYEENPLWIFLICWASALFIAAVHGRALIAICKTIASGK